MENLEGKKIQFLEDVKYSSLAGLNRKFVKRTYSLDSGIIFNGLGNEEMNGAQIRELEDYLKEMGFIRYQDVFIPKGTIGTITFHSSAGFDLKFYNCDELSINFENVFVFNENERSEDTIYVKIYDEE